MNKGVASGVVVLLAGVGAMLWWRSTPRGESPAPATRSTPSRPEPPPRVTSAAVDPRPRERPTAPTVGPEVSSQEKAARVEKIKRDYDDIRAKASAEYGAAGAAFPGGLSAFLRQLALLEREKRADLAKVLTAAELEQLEMRETTAGQMVERLLGPTAATPEQRRTVFGLQRGFEERFALSFDLAPRALLERETARQQVQEQIRAVLGDDLFGSWLRSEGEDYSSFASFAASHNLPASAAMDLRRIKNEFTLRRLELNATRTMTEEQRRAAQSSLIQQTEARLMSVTGQSAWPAARQSIIGWLPKK